MAKILWCKLELRCGLSVGLFAGRSVATTSIHLLMKTNTPSHEEITQRAQELWKAQGCPSGRDNEIWLEAERQLSAAASAPGDTGGSQERGSGRSQSSVTGGPPVDPKPPGASTEQVPPAPLEAAAQTEQQKKSARAPKSPTKSAPKSAPAETGKPLWKKPHSS